MKFYIASRLENAEQVKKLKRILESHGHEHTYDWTQHGSVQREGAEVIARVAQAEARGVREADTVIVLLPGGRGTHAELGMAITLSEWSWAGGSSWAMTFYDQAGAYMIQPHRRIFVLSESAEIDFGDDGRTCAFYHHPCVGRVDSWDGLLDLLGVPR